MKRTKIIYITIILIILFILSFLLIQSIQKQFINSNPFLDNNNINYISNNVIFWKQDMLDPRNTIGYPNLKKAYVVCYLNSALQLIKTFFINLFQMNSIIKSNSIPVKINYFLNYINEDNRDKAVHSMLKLLIPNENIRSDLFYINNNLHQSDSSEFLIYFLQYLFQKNLQLKNVFSFDLVSSLVSSLNQQLNSNKTEQETALIVNNINEFKNQNITNLSIILDSIISKPNLDILEYKFKDENNNLILNDLNTIKTVYYSNFSSFLLVVLNIFTFDLQENITKKIDFYTEIPDTVSFTTIDSIEYNYSPISIICHNGGESANSGHYVNYSKNIQNDKWYLYNDINVYEISDNSLNKSILKNKFNPFVVLLKKV